MLNVLSKTKPPTVADLEQAVADAAKVVARARQAHRNAREKHAEAVATLAEVPNSDALSDAVSIALDDMAQHGDALGNAMAALAESERSLTTAREAPARAALAGEFVRHADLLDAFDIKGVLNLRDALRASFFPIAVMHMPAGGTYVHREFVNVIEAAANEVSAGRLTAYAAFLRSYARQLIDGTVPLDVGPCIPPVS